MPTRVTTRDCYAVRHAHRDTRDRARDNGLSRKGRDQAARLAARLAALPAAPRVIRSSPKRRCVETAAPIARRFGVAVLVDADLDEQGARESDRAFRRRIARVLARAARDARGGRPVVLVTHGDLVGLLPAVAVGARARTAEPFPCAKGAYHRLSLDGAAWSVASSNDRAHLARASREP